MYMPTHIRRVLSVATSFSECEADNRAYWLSRPAWERWQAIELMRQLTHGTNYPTERLQRVFEIAERSRR
jgi:hypothetical protein